MAADLKFAPEAESDVAEIYGWYEQRRLGLGEEFLTALDVAVQRVLLNPNLYEVLRKKYRRVLLQRFPYLCLYEFTDNLVTIYGVFHTSRDPKLWNERLR